MELLGMAGEKPAGRSSDPGASSCGAHLPHRLTHFIFKEDDMHTQIFAGIKRFIRDEEGAAAVEYGLLAALIAVVVVVAVSAVGSEVCKTFSTITEKLGGAAVQCKGRLS